MANEQRVLVVDDEGTIRHLLTAALRQRSIVFDEASNGGEAIELLSQHRYSVLVLDLLMPGVDGFAVLNALTQETFGNPVVLVISGAGPELTARLDPSRIHGIVRKPFDAREVAAVVAAIFEIRARSPFETMALATVISGTSLMSFWPPS